VPAAALRAPLEQLVAAGGVVAAPGGLHFDGVALEELADELLAALGAEHKARPLLDWAELKDVRSRVDAQDVAIEAVLAGDRRFETAPGGRLRRHGHRAQLSNAQRDARERTLAALAAGGAAPPAIDAAFTGLPEKDTRALVSMLRAAGEVVAVEQHLFHPEALERMRAIIREHGRARQGAIAIPELRDELATTRKYLIPLLEFFDAEGLTVRHGEKRTLRHVDLPA